MVRANIAQQLLKQKMHSTTTCNLSSQIFRIFLLPALPIPPIVNEAAQLVLPIDLQIGQGILVPHLHLVDDLKGQVLVATTFGTSIV